MEQQLTANMLTNHTVIGLASEWHLRGQVLGAHGKVIDLLKSFWTLDRWWQVQKVISCHINRLTIDKMNLPPIVHIHAWNHCAFFDIILFLQCFHWQQSEIGGFKLVPNKKLSKRSIYLYTNPISFFHCHQMSNKCPIVNVFWWVHLSILFITKLLCFSSIRKCFLTQQKTAQWSDFKL